MTTAEIYVAVVQLIVAGVIVNVMTAALFVIATICEYLFHSVPFKAIIEYFYDFYLESFLPTLILLIMAALALKVMGGY